MKRTTFTRNGDVAFVVRAAAVTVGDVFAVGTSEVGDVSFDGEDIESSFYESARARSERCISRDEKHWRAIHARKVKPKAVK